MLSDHYNPQGQVTEECPLPQLLKYKADPRFWNIHRKLGRLASPGSYCEAGQRPCTVTVFTCRNTALHNAAP